MSTGDTPSKPLDTWVGDDYDFFAAPSDDSTDKQTMLTRLPAPALRPWLRMLWATTAATPGRAVVRERVLPTGMMHIAFRLSDEPLRILDPCDGRRVALAAHAVVGGARTGPYLREMATPAASVGALLNPGASEALLGVPAASLGETHTALESLWGPDVLRLTERLMAEPCPASRLDLFENALAARLPSLRRMHPAVAHALVRWHTYESVHDMVSNTGYSHRRFNALFRDAVGITPKRYGRVLRFSALLDDLAAPGKSLADVATDAGYSDQSHFHRDFREFAGMTPAEYRASAPERPHHVALS